MGCGTKEQYDSLGRVDSALKLLSRAGVGFENPVYTQLYKARGAILGNLGVRVPRSVTSLLSILGLSPGKVDLFFDADYGWVTVARGSTEAPPVYRVVPDETAVKIIQRSLTHEDFEQLKAPDDYLGE